MNPDQKRRAEQLTSLFENDTIELQYDYAEDIHDGRGITSGRAGFTTRTGDALEVVELYTQQKPDNGLAGFLPELRRLADANSGDTSNLEGYIEAWKEAAGDPVFRSVQDQIVDKDYYQPSVKHSEDAGLQTALAQAVLYDSIIQHGNGDDPDGLPALLQRAQDEAEGTPRTGVDEKAWLTVFLKVRREDLANPFNPETQEEWAKSVDRVDAFSAIAASENYNLDGPIEVHTENHNDTIP
jgi:chitosanase